VGSHQGQHAAHARRKIAVFYVQLPVQRKLALMTTRAKIVRSAKFHGAHDGEELAVPKFAVVSVPAANAGNPALLGTGFLGLQQLTEGCGSGSKHGRAERGLQRFQIRAIVLPAVLQNHLEQQAYLPGNFLLDRFRRFFSRDSSFSATSSGRSRQMAALTSIKDCT
jgi:hypothetical protein